MKDSMMQITEADLLNIAAEHARGWTEIWSLFVAVVAALTAAVVSLKKRLPVYVPILTAGFLVFSFMHTITIFRHYQTVWEIEQLLSELGGRNSGAVALARSIAPAELPMVMVGYSLCVVLGVLVITRAATATRVRALLRVELDNALLEEEGLVDPEWKQLIVLMVIAALPPLIIAISRLLP